MSSEPGRFGALTEGHPSVGEKCPACNLPLAVGDKPALVSIGPGDDAEEREKAASGRAYNAVAVVAHEACVHGEQA